MKHFLAVLFFAGAIAIAADPAGFVVYRASDLQGYSKKLAPKMSAQKVATQTLDRFGNHFTMIAHREGNGEAELHEKDADLFVIESGDAMLIVGGKVHSPKTTQPNEIRGPSIDGGTKHTVSAGDVVHIPANVPHQMMVDNGKQVTYFVMKVESR